jgi:hypothetical protein
VVASRVLSRSRARSSSAQRGRSVNEIYIHPEQGFTGHGSFDTDYKDDDHQFIVWAGPWVASTKVVYESGRELRTGVS